MTSDGALLALIIDDERALLLLAAWGALGPPLSGIDDRDMITRLSELCRTR